MNPDDARNFIMAMNAITGFVPPMMMGQLINSPVAMILQAVANGQMRLAPVQEQNSGSGEAGPPQRPHLVKPDASADAAHTAT